MDKDDKKVKKKENLPVGEEEKDKSKEEIAHLKNKILELENQVKRIFADYQNLEKRVALERGEWLIKANKDLILRFLPAIDFLLLSSKHIEDEGLKLSIQKFFDILKDEGVEKIEAVGKKFDPNLMEAITTVAGEEDKVITELRSGFKMGEQVLRPVQVAVGKRETN
jgi:molecular chaperone GrpE